MNAQAVRLTEVDIDNALANDHLGVVFQPIFSFADGGLTRMEAFVRWDHPGLGSLPPGAFISFFESQGRMGELTRHVLTRSLRSYKSWRGASGPGCSVNLAQSDLTDEAFPEDLDAILTEEGMPARLVTLECPPMPSGVDAAEARAIYARLAEIGCPLSVEVRGAAPESLLQADPFPFAEVKTGGSAILRFARTARGGASLDAISALLDVAKRHGARTVAVGVEDGDAALALKQLGFDAGQGKLLGGAGALAAFSAQSINGARAALGMEALAQDALGKMVERKRDDETPDEDAAASEAREPAAKDEPLVLTTPSGAEDDAQAAQAEDTPTAEATGTDAEPAAGAASDQPAEEDPTAVAIARLKARKIAAKRIALRRAEEARRRAEEESAAARQASETARRLQERLAAQIEAERPPAPEPAAPAEEAPSVPEAKSIAVTPAEPTQTEGTAAPEIGAPETTASDTTAPEAVSVEAMLAPMEEAPVDTLARPAAPQETADDEEAGLLLSDNLAEVALGIAKHPGFEDGIRLDGYTPSGPAAPAGAEAALMGAFAPTQEPGVRDGDERPVAFTSMATAIHAILDELPVPEGAKPRLMRSATMPLGEDDTLDLAPADALDAVVATAPVLDDDTLSAAAEATGSEDEAQMAARLRTRPRREKNLLTRKYRITHFWPRPWVRAVRKMRAPRVAAPVAIEAEVDVV